MIEVVEGIKRCPLLLLYARVRLLTHLGTGLLLNLLVRERWLFVSQ